MNKGRRGRREFSLRRSRSLVLFTDDSKVEEEEEKKLIFNSFFVYHDAKANFFLHI